MRFRVCRRRQLTTTTMASRIALNSLRASGMSFSLALHILPFPLLTCLFCHSVARTTSCGCPANPLCVRLARSDFSLPSNCSAHAPPLPPSFVLYSRTMASSSSNPPPPAERAAEIIDKLPSHPSLVTKTGTAILGSGLLATAISQELYVFNEETVIAVGFFILFGYIAKVRRSVSFPPTPPVCYPSVPKDGKVFFYLLQRSPPLSCFLVVLEGRRKGC